MTPDGAARPETRGFGRADSGATAIEYALIAALISVFVVSAMSFTGNGVKLTYNVITNAITGVFGN